REKEAQLKPKVKPGTKLAILVFKDDQAGQVYSRLKQEAGKRLGIEVITSSDTGKLTEWNQDELIQGVMIQRPGYRGKEFEKQWAQLVETIVPSKDVDGLRENSPFIQATVRAVEVILKTVPFRNGTEKIVVVGRGMVGRKLAVRLKGLELSSRDKDLKNKTREADILISCTGREKLITAEMVKPGATVIDVGWPKGDVDFAVVKNVAGAITPVPGGVGPVTVVCLLENLANSRYTS
ncbi:MAG: bifunctional 5,10-methylenetetrahydrofolate dehydrogenase/5,10-methenyltetrahydrofolate cyclohydrolase, partial [Patescibacteria group bacterium]